MLNKNDKKELIRLMQEYPDLPVVFYVSNDEIAYDYGSTVMQDFWAYKDTIYIYQNYDGEHYTEDRIEIKEYYMDYFADADEYKDFSDEDYEKAIEEYIDKTIPKFDAIIISVS